jgi:epoxyqueuosine reductase QueG
MNERLRDDPAGGIAELIRDVVAGSPDNDLKLVGNEPAFNAPLVGFASGADPLWEKYTAHIGDFYLTPAVIFRNAFPDKRPPPADGLTVISWVLPLTQQTRREQARQTKKPSERWFRTRYYGEAFNDTLRRHVVERLGMAGIAAVAPMLAGFWRRSDQGPYAPCSNWSERHAAYAAGLGTFGLCDGLITPVGKAMRTGSVVARVTVSPTPRPYTDRHAYCLFYSHGTCGKCIDRCPVKAISRDGHNKRICMKYTESTMNAYAREAFAIDIPACGLCQSWVPCTDHIPKPEEGH